MKFFIITIYILLAPIFLLAQKKSMGSTDKRFQKPNLCFIENKGQITDQNGATRNDIQYEVKAALGLNIFIGEGVIHYQFYKVNDPNSQPSLRKAMADVAKFKKKQYSFC